MNRLFIFFCFTLKDITIFRVVFVCLFVLLLWKIYYLYTIAVTCLSYFVPTVKKFFRLLYHFYFSQFEILENDDDRKFINIEKMLDDNACAVSLTYYSKVPVKSRPVIRFKRLVDRTRFLLELMVLFVYFMIGDLLETNRRLSTIVIN